MAKRRHSAPAFSGRVVSAILAACGSSDVALAAAGDLPIGMQSEPTFVVTALRVFGVAWGVVLLLVGFRIPAAVVGTFLLIVGAGAGWWAVAETSLLMALCAAVLIFGVGMATYLWFPRVVMAVAMLWPLPLLYLARLYFTGSFGRSWFVAVTLALLGTVVGAVFPRRSVVVLSVAVGTALLFIAGPFNASFAGVVAASGIAIAWQLVVVVAWRPKGRSVGWTDDAGERQRVTRLWRSVKCAAVVVVVGLVLVGWTAPMYDVGKVPKNDRLVRLAKDGKLGRPALVISPLNNYYLSGRRVPVAVISERASLLTRLSFPLLGQSIVRQVRAMRAVKDDVELRAMRRAAEITSSTFADIAPLIRPGVSEADIERRILMSYRDHGATGVAFTSIVGSGPNAVLPHYDKNDAIMEEGLVVIDIGCSVDNYASDMTRTFSVTGEYSEAHRHLIETVIEAGDAARAALGPGVTLEQVDSAARDVIEEQGFGRFFVHRVGHPVGLKVHDPGRSPLEPGMVVTIEPGIYIPDGADVDPSYWNLGVRIEDSYIVTEDGWDEITSYPRLPYSD